MNKGRRAWLWLIVPLLSLALISCFLVWTIPKPNATVRFVRFETRDGQRFAVFRVENQSAKDLKFYGHNGVPQSTFLEDQTAGPVTGPAWTGLSKGSIGTDVLVAVGKSVDFAVPLRWMINGDPIRGSFQIGLIDPNAERNAVQDFLRQLQWIGRPHPLEQHPWIWSDLVSQ